MFREKGFDGIGVADLMRAAGMTHGGFYNHFASKEELESAACDLAFDKAVANLTAMATQSGAARRTAFAAYVDRYLSPRMRDAAVACPMVALGGEAPRRGTALRRRFAAGVRHYIVALGEVMARPGRKAAQAREQAIVTLALLVGGLLLARGIKEADLALSDEILASVQNAVSGHAR
jgi:TetR/AcrR family transcriptional repressor of nem operon